MAMDNDQFQKPSPESLDAGYETSGVSVKGLAIFVVGLIVFAAVIHIAVWFLFKGYLKADEAKDRSDSALTDPRAVSQFNQQHDTHFPTATPGLPPPPRLQPTPGVEPPRVAAADLQEMYRQEDTVFAQMGWTIDQRTHVPVEIPESVLAAVIQDATQRQQAKKSGRRPLTN
jgi:hypothetical protein